MHCKQSALAILNTSYSNTIIEILQENFDKVVIIRYNYQSHGYSREIYENGVCNTTQIKLPIVRGKLSNIWSAAHFLLGCAIINYFILTSLKIGESFAICLAQGWAYVISTDLLRRFRRIKKLIWLCEDWFPPATVKRYSISMPILLRNLYPKIDRFCSLHSDIIWNTTQKIDQARLDYAGTKKEVISSKTVLVKPPFNIKIHYRDATKPYKIVHLGYIRADRGLEELIESLSLLYDKGYEVELHFLGQIHLLSDIYTKKILSSSHAKKMENRIIMHGYVPDALISEKLTDCLCGICIFPGGNANYSNFAFPSKFVQYIQNGLPVLANDDSAIGEIIQQNHLGMTISTIEGKSIAGSIEKMIVDVESNNYYRMNVRNYVEKNADSDIRASISSLSKRNNSITNS